MLENPGSAPSPPESPEGATAAGDDELAPAAVELRNRFLASLLKGSGARSGAMVMVRCEPRVAVLLLEPQTQILILTRPVQSSARLDKVLAAVIDAQPGGVFHLILVGGAADLRGQLEKLVAAAPDPRGLGIHMIDDAGSLIHVGGRHLSALTEAAAQIHRNDPLSQQDIEDIVKNTYRTHHEAAHFASRISRRFPLVSSIIGLVCVFLFLAWQADTGGVFGSVFRNAGVNMGALVSEGQWWRLLTSAFLHANLTHLAMNMMVLYFVGTFLERVMGRHRFLLIYGAAALAGSCASAFLAPGQPSLGASGALWGVMAAGFGVSVWPRGLMPTVVALRLKRGLMTPLLLNVGISFLPGIDYRAHFGGGAVGLLFALTGLAGNSLGKKVQTPQPGPAEPAARGRDPRAPSPVAIRVAAILVTCMMIVSLLATWQTAQRAQLLLDLQ